MAVSYSLPSALNRANKALTGGFQVTAHWTAVSPNISRCDLVFVAGFPAPENSGIQGFFAWRPDSTEPDNGGTVIKPNALAAQSQGRWHRVFDGPVSVKWFGAKGDSSGNDTDAIQATIVAASSSCTPTVYIPPGRFRLTRAIRPEFDNFTLLGDVNSVLVADPSDREQFPEAILVNRGFPNLCEVSRLRIRDLTIEVMNGGDSAGAIQLNNCTDCVVSDILVKYVGARNPKNFDGIVTSQGTSGLIQNCIVDGIPKVGIYLTPGSHDVRVIDCEVKNTTGPVDQVGISVGGADRILIANCLSHHNGKAGLFIGVGVNPPVPSTNIQVSSCLFFDNKFEGVRIGSEVDGVRPESIRLVGVAALNNDGRGISVEAGWDVLIADPTVADSGAQGIWLENVPMDPNKPRTTRVQISNPQIYNNGRIVDVDVPGIGLRAVKQVTITGGKLSKTPSMSTRHQNYGIGLYLNRFGAACKDIRILDPDASVGQLKPIAALHSDTEDNKAVAQSGFYRLQGTVNPQGFLSAPLGSEFVDLSTGFAYRKATGTGPTGWVHCWPNSAQLKTRNAFQIH
jgi:hypothetical protein